MYIKNFLQFINEEVAVKYFQNFKNALVQMSSPVAKYLVEIEDTDLDVSYNSINLTDKNDEVSFYPVNREVTEWNIDPDYVFPSDGPIMVYLYNKFPKPEGVEWIPYCENCFFKLFGSSGGPLDPENLENIKILKLFTKQELLDLGFDDIETWVAMELPCSHKDMYYFNDRLDKLQIEVEYNFFNLTYKSKSEKMAIIEFQYLGKKYLNCMSFDALKPKNVSGGVQIMGIGRLAQRITSQTGKSFTQKEIADFTEEFKATVDSFQNIETRMRLVEGEDIRKFYNQKNYITNANNSLQNSCMRYQRCQPFFDLYVENPKVCKMLILESAKQPGKIEARALVWKLMNGKTFMDRVYFSTPSQEITFINYAKGKGWLWKRSSNGPITVMEGEKAFYDDIAVKLEKFKFEYYPYLDTLDYLDKYDSVLHDGSGDWACDLELHRPDGHPFAEILQRVGQ